MATIALTMATTALTMAVPATEGIIALTTVAPATEGTTAPEAMGIIVRRLHLVRHAITATATVIRCLSSAHTTVRCPLPAGTM